MGFVFSRDGSLWHCKDAPVHLPGDQALFCLTVLPLYWGALVLPSLYTFVSFRFFILVRTVARSQDQQQCLRRRMLTGAWNSFLRGLGSAKISSRLGIFMTLTPVEDGDWIVA